MDRIAAIFQKWKNSSAGIRWITLISLLCVLLLMLAGWHMRRTMPDIPISDPDTRGYLNPALCWLDGRGFLQTDGREWFYPAFLTAILKCTGSFDAIALFQEIIGILGTLVLWESFRRWLLLYADGNFWIHLLGQLLILPVVALYALNPNLILFEKSIRPESLMVFFTLCYFLMLAGFFDARWRRPRLIPALFYGSATLLSSYIVFVLKPSWTLALPVSTLPLIVGLVGRQSLPLRALPLLGGIFLMFAFAIMGKLTGFRKEAHAGTYLPFTLVSIHSEEILASCKKRLLTVPEDQARPLAAFTSTLEKALAENRVHPYPFTVLGYHADNIMYRSPVFQTNYNPDWSARDFENFCYSLYFHAWLDEPGGMANKIWRQLTLFLFPHGSDYYFFDNTSKRLNKNYAETLSSHRAANYKLPPALSANFGRYLSALENLAKQNTTLEIPRILISLGNLLAMFSLWIQILFFAVLAATFRRSAFPSRLAGLFILSLTLCMYGYIMTVAMVHTLDMTRYRTPFAAFFSPILTMMLTYCLVALCQLLAPRFGIRPSDHRPGT